MARILVIASFTPSLVKFRGDMLRDFIARGYEVMCCSPDPDPLSLEQLEQIGASHREFDLQRTGMNPFADLTTIRDLRRIMAAEKPDHVLSYTIKPIIYGSLAAGRQKIPGIHAMITGLGTTFMNSGLKEKLIGQYARFMYKAALKECRTVFFQNPDDRSTFLELGLVSDGQVVMINGSGINLERFPARQIPPGPPVFLMIARLIREKGIVEFAEAARKVKTVYPAARFQVAGFFDDHPRSIGRAEMDTWTADGTLEFLGFADDVRPLLASCSVYCLPSYREGTPRTVLEAMATGRPIITTDAPGCRETVESGGNGFLVPVGNTDALAAAMKKFCADGDLMQEMGTKSRRLAETRFDVVKVNRVIADGMGLESGQVPAQDEV